MTLTEEVQLAFELGWTTPTLRSLFGTNNGIAGHVLLEGGTEDQRASWLPRLASGEVTASFGLTEADAGSDPSGLLTTARRDGTDWVINGSKRYITNAPVAEVLMIFARTNHDVPANRGISTFLVPADAAGRLDRPEGPEDGPVRRLDRRRPPRRRPRARRRARGRRGRASTTGSGSPPSASRTAGRTSRRICVGMAGRLVHESVEFARTRMQGGRPIASFQLVQGLIADSVTDHYAGRALVLDVARRYDDGSDRMQGPAAAKYFASEMVGRVADRAVQVHGGAGYMRGVAVERFYRDARLFRIYEGTSQIQQVIIARQALGRAARG